MSLSLLLYTPVFALYLWAIAIKFGIVIGLHVSLLTLSFFVLFTPLASYFSTIAFFLSPMQSRDRGVNLVGMWFFLVVLNSLSLWAVPMIYSKVHITGILYHFLILPSVGIIPVSLSGLSLVYHWAISRYVWTFNAGKYHVFGTILTTLAFYYFFGSSFYEEYIISLNTGGLNY